ncbi:hypothetical protein [Lichenifustis flavocetrariae]|uniref:Uncharacterized protein n=1 Tax=Lichenifustis flavocetrariae TaxID=2949735 RepID=A0AA41YTI1_9HYPH|nr:hypothetical protein [Lichenifustis flavocetrariae]MCW6506742.1 hypothetical protein [Lichenifustis flavocetrariae]
MTGQPTARRNWVHRSVLLTALTLGLLDIWIAVVSLRWPLVGDAAMFHFAVSQFMLGAVPYKDFIDMNMPLIYVIHAAVIWVGGMGDLAFRIFDLGSSVAIGLLAGALVRPAGLSNAFLAAVTIIAAHLLFGPQAAGERDFLLLGPAFTAALCSVRAAERPSAGFPWLFAAGVAVGLAALLKPTAVILLALPLTVRPFRVANLLVGGAGLCSIALVTLLVMTDLGATEAFIRDFRDYEPFYVGLAHRSWLVLPAVALKHTGLGVGGLLLAAVFCVRAETSPRLLVLIGLAVFGAIHFMLQGKGFFYHAYPLIGGVACLSAWSLPKTPVPFTCAALGVSAAVFGTQAVQAFEYSRFPADLIMPAPVSRTLQDALKAHVAAGARVQMLDMSGGAFLAMARSGLRQATPYAYWLYLAPGKPAWRSEFVKDIQSRPPDAILVTDATWPSEDGLKAVDDWPEFSAELACCYRLIEAQTRTEPSIPWFASSPSVSWRLYVLRGPAG